MTKARSSLGSLATLIVLSTAMGPVHVAFMRSAKAAPATSVRKLTWAEVSEFLFPPAGRDARAVPEIRDGRPVGVRLYSVRPGGVIDRLGLKNADVIHTASDVPIFAPDGRSRVLEAVKRSGRLVLVGWRGGEALRIEHDVDTGVRAGDAGAKAK